MHNLSRLSAILLVAMTVIPALLLPLTSCNSDPDTATTTVNYGSAAVKGFALKSDTAVLANLDSINFSIDLDNAHIFNADSLPKGTDVSRLLVSLTTPTLSACDFLVPEEDGTTTTIDYLSSQTDSIDFSRGGVKLRVTSYDGATTITYRVDVNVHLVDPDSLEWSKLLMQELPTSLSSPVQQKTVDYQGHALTLTVDASGNACLARCSTTSPIDEQWEYKKVTLPPGSVVRSLTATSDGYLWIADDQSVLHKSLDMGTSWASTDGLMTNIIGSAGTTVLGTYNDGSAWTIATWPDKTSIAAPASFPVEGHSQLVVYTSDWSATPTAIMTGGRLADGSLTNATWAWDGSIWARIDKTTTVNPMAELEDMSLVPYFAYKTSEYWRVSQETILVAMGGFTSAGTAVRTVYVSYDRGVHWAQMTSTMALPSYIGAFGAADVLVYDNEMSVSRVSQAITEWDCPAIYLFGGMSGVTTIGSESTLYDTVWHGVVNRLTFKPLY